MCTVFLGQNSTATPGKTLCQRIGLRVYHKKSFKFYATSHFHHNGSLPNSRSEIQTQNAKFRIVIVTLVVELQCVSISFHRLLLFITKNISWRSKEEVKHPIIIAPVPWQK